MGHGQRGGNVGGEDVPTLGDIVPHLRDHALALGGGESCRWPDIGRELGHQGASDDVEHGDAGEEGAGAKQLDDQRRHHDHADELGHVEGQVEERVGGNELLLGKEHGDGSGLGRGEELTDDGEDKGDQVDEPDGLVKDQVAKHHHGAQQDGDEQYRLLLRPVHEDPCQNAKDDARQDEGEDGHRHVSGGVRSYLNKHQQPEVDGILSDLGDGLGYPEEHEVAIAVDGDHGRCGRGRLQGHVVWRS